MTTPLPQPELPARALMSSAEKDKLAGGVVSSRPSGFDDTHLSVATSFIHFTLSYR